MTRKRRSHALVWWRWYHPTCRDGDLRCDALVPEDLFQLSPWSGLPCDIAAYNLKWSDIWSMETRSGCRMWVTTRWEKVRRVHLCVID